MAAVKVSTVTVTVIENKPTTLSTLQALYDAVHKFEKQTGNEKEFLEKFGSRKQWLGQFKNQPYDVNYQRLKGLAWNGRVRFPFDNVYWT